jgi:hypothetical protein
LRSGASVAAGRAAAHRYSRHALASVMRAAGLPSPNTWYWSRSVRALPAGAIRASAHPERCRSGVARCRRPARRRGPGGCLPGAIRAPALPERCRVGLRCGASCRGGGPHAAVVRAAGVAYFSGRAVLFPSDAGVTEASLEKHRVSPGPGAGMAGQGELV